MHNEITWPAGGDSYPGVSRPCLAPLKPPPGLPGPPARPAAGAVRGPEEHRPLKSPLGPKCFEGGLSPSYPPATPLPALRLPLTFPITRLQANCSGGKRMGRWGVEKPPSPINSHHCHLHIQLLKLRSSAADVTFTSLSSSFFFFFFIFQEAMLFP